MIQVMQPFYTSFPLELSVLSLLVPSGARMFLFSLLLKRPAKYCSFLKPFLASVTFYLLMLNLILEILQLQYSVLGSSLAFQLPLGAYGNSLQWGLFCNHSPLPPQNPILLKPCSVTANSFASVHFDGLNLHAQFSMVSTSGTIQTNVLKIFYS